MIEIRHPHIEDTTHEIEAYNTLYTNKGIQHLDSLYLWLVELLKPRAGQTLVDVSCGQGALVRGAAKQRLKAIGVDFSEAALHIASQTADQSGLGYGLSNAEALPFRDHSVDLVTNIGSIEHYLDPAQGVREISRILKPEGTACILLPNGFCLLGNIKHVWQTGEVYDDGQPLQRYNTLNGWHQLLVENGLHPFKTAKFEMVRPRTWPDLFWYLKRPAKVAHLMLAPFIPLSLSNCFVYLCRPTGTFSD